MQNIVEKLGFSPDKIKIVNRIFLSQKSYPLFFLENEILLFWLFYLN